MGKCLFMRKGEVHTTPLALPSGYTRLAYIQSSGTQYVNTGFKPDQNTRLVVSYYATAEGFIAGSETGWKSKSFDIHTKLVAYNASSSNFTNVLNTKIAADFNKNVFSDDAGRSATFTSATFTSGLPLFLFASNRAGTATEAFHGRIYTCQIYNNDILARKFIPCINTSGAVGLYDLVGKQFYGNAGTGVFVGSEVA